MRCCSLIIFHEVLIGFIKNTYRSYSSITIINNGLQLSQLQLLKTLKATILRNKQTNVNCQIYVNTSKRRQTINIEQYDGRGCKIAFTLR